MISRVSHCFATNTSHIQPFNPQHHMLPMRAFVSLPHSRAPRFLMMGNIWLSKWRLISSQMPGNELFCAGVQDDLDFSFLLRDRLSIRSTSTLSSVRAVNEVMDWVGRLEGDGRWLIWLYRNSTDNVTAVATKIRSNASSLSLHLLAHTCTPLSFPLCFCLPHSLSVETS